MVFYCGGITCTLSPNSLRKAETMGYTNLRVYREGMPEWQTRNFAVLTPQFLKAAYIDQDIPHVLIDARSARRRHQRPHQGRGVAARRPSSRRR